MEYKVQTTETRIYTPNETLKSLHNLVMKFDNMASLLIQEYLKELIKLEQNNNEKAIFKTYCMNDKIINQANFDLLIEKFIKPVFPDSQLSDNSKLFYVLHETFELFPNLFKMYCDENEYRDLLISAGVSRDNTRDYSFHSEDMVNYENWIVETCLGIEHKNPYF